MKRFTLSLATTAVLFSTVPPSLHAAPPPAGTTAQQQQAATVRWQTNLQAAHKIAVAEGKPILIVFGASWCVFCKKLEKQTLNTPEMAKYINDNFVPVHLDLDRDKRVAQILEVEALPCSLIVTPNADLLGRIDGYHTPGPFFEKLTAAQQNQAKVQATAHGDGPTVR